MEGTCIYVFGVHELVCSVHSLQIHQKFAIVELNSVEPN